MEKVGYLYLVIKNIKLKSLKKIPISTIHIQKTKVESLKSTLIPCISSYLMKIEENLC